MYKKLEAQITQQNRKFLKSVCDKLSAYRIRTRVAWITGSLVFECDGLITPRLLDLINSIGVISSIDFQRKEICGKLKVDYMVAICRDCGRQLDLDRSTAKAR